VQDRIWSSTDPLLRAKAKALPRRHGRHEEKSAAKYAAYWIVSFASLRVLRAFVATLLIFIRTLQRKSPACAGLFRVACTNSSDLTA
jgi:hypothetical protein